MTRPPFQRIQLFSLPTEGTVPHTAVEAMQARPPPLPFLAHPSPQGSLALPEWEKQVEKEEDALLSSAAQPPQA